MQDVHDVEAPLSPTRSRSPSRSPNLSPTLRRNNTRTDQPFRRAVRNTRRHSTLMEGRNRRTSLQVGDMMDMSMPSHMPSAGSSTKSAPGLSVSRDSISATSDMINMLGQFQMNSSLNHFGSSTRRGSGNPSWMQKQASSMNEEDDEYNRVNLMDMSAPAHYQSMGASTNLRGSSNRRPSIAIESLSGAADTITGAASNLASFVTDAMGGSLRRDSAGWQADLMKQRREFQRSRTVENASTTSSNKDSSQELILLRASVAEKDVQIEELRRQLDDANDVIREETQSNLDLEDSEDEDMDVSAHLDSESELRQSMRTRMTSAAYDAREPYIPSAWNTPEEFQQQQLVLEAKLAAAVADQEASKRFLKEREAQIACLQRENERHTETQNKLKAKLQKLDQRQIEQITMLKEKSLKALEDEQADSERQLKRQALQFQQRAEKAVAILEEMHTKDKEELKEQLAEAALEQQKDLDQKIQQQTAEIELLKKEKEAAEKAKEAAIKEATESKAKNGVVHASGRPKVQPSLSAKSSLKAALEKTKPKAGGMDTSQHSAQTAQSAKLAEQMAEMEKKLKEQEEKCQQREAEFVQHQTKLQEQEQQLEALQKANEQSQKEKAAAEEKLAKALKDVDKMKKQQRSQRSASALLQASATQVSPKKGGTGMGDKIRARMQEQATMLSKMKQGQQLSVEF